MRENWNQVDIHSHVLPGIDDGARDWNMSLRMLKKAYDAGVRKVIGTPHYLPWKEPVDPEKIRLLCKQAKEKFKQEYDLEMDLYPGEELYFHQELLEKLKTGQVLTLADSSYILVEFDTDIPWSSIKQGMSHLRVHGYRPIIAHVERYDCLRTSGRLEELKKADILLQMNVSSLSGPFWDRDARWCREQIKKQRVDFLASDMHNLTSRPPMQKEDFLWMYKNLTVVHEKNLIENQEKLHLQ